MKALVVKPKNEDEFKFITNLLNKLGIGSSTLTKAELEDIGMLKMMSNVDKSNKVDRQQIIKKLSYA